jgi:hypothetical protein
MGDGGWLLQSCCYAGVDVTLGLSVSKHYLEERGRGARPRDHGTGRVLGMGNMHSNRFQLEVIINSPIELVHVKRIEAAMATEAELCACYDDPEEIRLLNLEWWFIAVRIQDHCPISHLPPPYPLSSILYPLPFPSPVSSLRSPLPPAFPLPEPEKQDEKRDEREGEEDRATLVVDVGINHLGATVHA